MKALIALAAAALLLTGCSAQPVAPNSDIASLTFHQYQAIENFDDSEYTQDDPTEVARFVSLLDEFGVVPGVTVTADQDECAGGLSSTVRVDSSGGESADMFIASCGKPEPPRIRAAGRTAAESWLKFVAHPPGPRF